MFNFVCGLVLGGFIGATYPVWVKGWLTMAWTWIKTKIQTQTPPKS